MSMQNVLRAGRRPVAIAAIAGLAVSGLSGVLPSAQAAAHALHTTGTVYLSEGSNSISYDFAEAPNGAVFYSRGADVYVVKGTSAPVQVVQATGNVLASGRRVSSTRLPRYW